MCRMFLAESPSVSSTTPNTHDAKPIVLRSPEGIARIVIRERGAKAIGKSCIRLRPIGHLALDARPAHATMSIVSTRQGLMNDSMHKLRWFRRRVGQRRY